MVQEHRRKKEDRTVGGFERSGRGDDDWTVYRKNILKMGEIEADESKERKIRVVFDKKRTISKELFYIFKQTN